MTSKPRFSIVIPTRERAHTLRWSLATCLAQQFENCEIIVSDNFSSPETHEVVDFLSDARLRYVRTPRPLAMTDSWEFALSHAAGEFVTVIGDDDGLMLHALPEIDRIISTLDAKVLRWESACYHWPCLVQNDVKVPDRLLLPLNQRDHIHRVNRYAAREMLAKAACFDTGYWQLPMIYNSMVHQSVLALLRERTGRVFRGQAPDVYSAFSIAAVVAEFYSADAPMAVGGLSGKSNGIATLYCKEKTAIAQEFSQLNSQAQWTWHARAVPLPTLSATAADSFLTARDAFFADDPDLSLDYRKLIVNCLCESGIRDDTEWHEVLRTIRRALSGNSALLAWFNTKHGDMTTDEVRSLRRPSALKRYGGSYLHLDTSEFGVTNVFEAAQLCEKILGYQHDGTNSHLIEVDSECAPNFVRNSFFQLAKQRIARLLARAA